VKAIVGHYYQTESGTFILSDETSDWTPTHTLTIAYPIQTITVPRPTPSLPYPPTPTTPTVSILSPKNGSFFDAPLGRYSFNLIYETDAELSWVGYSIDDNGSSQIGKSNSSVTISENGTMVLDSISIESSGYCTLTLYANDASGNWAVPQTVTYFVNFIPDWTPTPTPSPSPTQEPTAEPAQTAIPTNEAELFVDPPSYTGLYIFGGMTISTIIIAVGVVIYFKKYRKG
jgi:hypothetical protein